MGNSKIYGALFFLSIIGAGFAATPTDPHGTPAHPDAKPRITLEEFFTQAQAQPKLAAKAGTANAAKKPVLIPNFDEAKKILNTMAAELANSETKTDDELCRAFTDYHDQILAEGRLANEKAQTAPSLTTLLANNVPLNDLPTELSKFFSESRILHFTNRGDCPISKDAAAASHQRAKMKEVLGAYLVKVNFLNKALDAAHAKATE